MTLVHRSVNYLVLTSVEEELGCYPATQSCLEDRSWTSLNQALLLTKLQNIGQLIDQELLQESQGVSWGARVLHDDALHWIPFSGWHKMQAHLTKTSYQCSISAQRAKIWSTVELLSMNPDCSSKWLQICICSRRTANEAPCYDYIFQYEIMYYLP